jgi:hypothetical protein
MNKNKMGVACSAHGGDKMRTKFLLESLNGKDHLEDLNIDEKVIYKLVSANYDCIGFIQ